MPRLIDADAMRQEWLENGENEYVYDTNAVLDSIDSQPTVNQWIPVTERLPKAWKPVLVRSEYNFTTTAWYIGVPGKWRFTQTNEFMAKDSVTHWMPLPEAPKEETE